MEEGLGLPVGRSDPTLSLKHEDNMFVGLSW